MTDEISIGPAIPSDDVAIVALLEQAHLPTDDVTAHLGSAVVARHHGRIVGMVAIEVYPDGGLLRSVAVEGAYRGVGLGSRLTAAAIVEAQRRQLPALYLLTTTAEGFFPRFGFERIGRNDVPTSVQASVEFREACPASAAVLLKRLTSEK
jgi:amino-acid N-acetyltransferase